MVNDINPEKIGNKIDKFIEVEKELEKATNHYLRMKVEVDVSKSFNGWFLVDEFRRQGELGINKM